MQWSQNPKLIKYKHPSLETILSITHGCIIYQEQVIEIFRKLAGFSIGQADMIRRAMSKKKASEIEREKKAFIEGDSERGIIGAVNKGIPIGVASAIYEEIEAFANYAFNKSHAVGYAIISYQTAYLKCHFPHIYMAALMSSVLGSAEKIVEYTTTCRKMGIALLPPNINESGAMFTVAGNDLRYGLVAVKNIGHGFIEKVISERESDGKFKSFEDFCKRVYGGDANRRALESLIKCGCFDGLGANRRQLMMICQTVIDDITTHKRRNVEGQLDLFGMSSGAEDIAGVDCGGNERELPDLPEFTKGELTRMEREVTGLYLSGHPLDDYRDVAKRSGAVSIGKILADFASDESPKTYKDNQKIAVAGAIESVKKRLTRNNTTWATVVLDDGTGAMELVAFQRVMDESETIMSAEELVLVHGRISKRDEKDPQITVDSMKLLKNVSAGSAGAGGAGAGAGGNTGNTGTGRADTDSARANTADTNNAPPHNPAPPKNATKTLYVQIESESSSEYEHLKLVHMMFPGREKMVVFFKDTKKKLGASCIIHEAFVKELTEKLGEKNVVVK